jgi:hypothetical protein
MIGSGKRGGRPVDDHPAGAQTDDAVSGISPVSGNPIRIASTGTREGKSAARTAPKSVTAWL